MEAKASTKYLRISSQKVNLVLELIRNKSTIEAVAILEQTNKKAAPLILKTLNSAIANATENHGMLADKLFVSRTVANEGPTLKRFRARAKGRADLKRKRTTILEVVVSDERKGRR